MESMGYSRSCSINFSGLLHRQLFVMEGLKGKLLKHYRVNPFTGTQIRKPEVIVLDGQQRLTALYYVFTAPDFPLPNRSNRAIYYIKVDDLWQKSTIRHFIRWLSRRWSKILGGCPYQYETIFFHSL